MSSVIPLPPQSTRLGKYINQVRRTISDKTLAKRMKRLVIQWRSLAQKSPTSAATNGVPCTSPSIADAIQPITSTCVSKPTPNSISLSLQPPAITSLTNPHPTPSAASAPQPSTLQPSTLPSSRPPTSNPTSHRKQLLHKLSKFSSNLLPTVPQSGAQPTQGSLPSRQHSSPPSPPPNTSVNHTLTRSPSPPQPPLPVASDMPRSPSLPPAPPSLPPAPPSLPPAPPAQVSLASSTPSSTTSSLVSAPPSSAGAVASSLPISLPFNSVDKCLVVQIPLAHATPLNATPATNHSAEAAPPTTEGAWHHSGKVCKLSEKRPRCLVVKISRQLVKRSENSSCAVTEETRPLSPAHVQLTSPLEPTVPENKHTSLPLHEEGPECSVSVLDTPCPVPSPGQQAAPLGLCPGVHGCYGSDGLWYSWTDPIIGQEFAVNVLPYVYIDGIQET